MHTGPHERADADDKYQPTPRWVKALAIAAAIAVVLIIVLMSVGGHGPGQHALAPISPHGAAAQRSI